MFEPKFLIRLTIVCRRAAEPRGRDFSVASDDDDDDDDELFRKAGEMLSKKDSLNSRISSFLSAFVLRSNDGR